MKVSISRPSLSVRFSEPATGVGAGSSQGPAGASGAGYVHTQSVAAAEWTINHNLGFRPGVSILDASGYEVLGDVFHYSANVVIVTFAAPLAGSARLT